MTTPSGRVTLGMEFFESLNPKDKGYFGEKIVSFYLRNHMDDSPERIFPCFTDVDREQINLPTPERFYYAFVETNAGPVELISRPNHLIKQYLLDEDGDKRPVGTTEEWPEDRKPWMPDITLRMRSREDDIKREILCEVKTGPYAEFHGDQRDVMEILNRNPDRLLLRAAVTFDAQSDSIRIRFKKLETTDLDDHTDWTDWDI